MPLGRNPQTRRRFLGTTLAAASGAGLLAVRSREEHALLAWSEQAVAGGTADVVDLPCGHIGQVPVSRLICGGNLFSGFAHSRDLIYVSELMKHYFTPERVLDTLQLCEQNGINTAVLRADDHVTGLLDRYRQERGGKIQWLAQIYPTEQHPLDNAQLALEHGAIGAFLQGLTADRLVSSGRMDVVAEVLSYLQERRLLAGVGAHRLDTLRAVERAGLQPDFYFKTFNNLDFHSERPAEVAEFMQTVTRPWIAFKVLGAGAVTPSDGFRLALTSGADFLTVGMFDFQVRDNAALVRSLLAGSLTRQRPWRA